MIMMRLSSLKMDAIEYSKKKMLLVWDHKIVEAEWVDTHLGLFKILDVSELSDKFLMVADCDDLVEGLHID